MDSDTQPQPNLEPHPHTETEPTIFEKCWTQLERVPYKMYAQIFAFWVLHMYRLFLGWVKSYMIEPLEIFLDKYAKKEPIESQWFQIYHLTTAYAYNRLNIEDWYYDCEETFYYPSTNDFASFVFGEYQHILAHPLKMPPYNAELNQVPDIIETLLVAKNDHMYAFRTLPAMRSITKEKKEWNYDPKISDVEFILVEYVHPRIPQGIIFNIPRGYYLVGNELFSPAFIQRYLELQKKYYVFDEDYELIFVDHLCEKKVLNYKQYIVLSVEGYTINNVHNEEEDNTKDLEKEVDDENENENENDIDSNEADPGTVSPYATLHSKTESDIDVDSDYDTDIDESREIVRSKTWIGYFGWD